jgi:hypothetical protein
LICNKNNFYKTLAVIQAEETSNPNTRHNEPTVEKGIHNKHLCARNIKKLKN